MYKWFYESNLGVFLLKAIWLLNKKQLKNAKTIKEFAQAYRSYGFNLSCILPRRNEYSNPYDCYKSPSHEWKQFKCEKQSLNKLVGYEWNNSCGVGLVLGFNNLRALDIDGCSDPDFIEEILGRINLPINYKWVVKTGSNNGFHIIFFSDNHSFPIKNNRVIKAFRSNYAYKNSFEKIELRWSEHLVLPPSKHSSGGKYKFYNGFPEASPEKVDVTLVEEMICITCGLDIKKNSLLLQNPRADSSSEDEYLDIEKHFSQEIIDKILELHIYRSSEEEYAKHKYIKPLLYQDDEEEFNNEDGFEEGEDEDALNNDYEFDEEDYDDEEISAEDLHYDKLFSENYSLEKQDLATNLYLRRKVTEELPSVKQESTSVSNAHLFVNFQLNEFRDTERYPIVKVPQKGCIIRSHRFGNTKRRGFKECEFQQSLENVFGSYFLVSGKVRLNTGKNTRPFEPDIAIIDLKSGNNIRVDIEIDEPYAGISRQSTHCKGDDVLRDSYFTDRGWIVIRFSEYQVHVQEANCLKIIAQVLNEVDSSFTIPSDLVSASDLEHESQWDNVQAQKWEKEKYRERYLNHTFNDVAEERETVERGLNTQENCEEKLVKQRIVGVPAKVESVGFNKSNIHPRDSRIVFYPEKHVYTIDGVPSKSASSVINSFFPEFDIEYWSKRKAPELGMNPTEVVLMWKSNGEKAAKEGTYLHEQIERFYLRDDYTRTIEFDLFDEFVEDHKTLKPYRTEWRIFDEEYNVAGTIDLLARNTNGFEMFDWKRSKKIIDLNTGEPIIENPWQSGIGALSDIPDTSYNKYCIQQSLYRYILESNYDMKIEKMYLVVLHPDYPNYYKLEVPYWKETIEYILKTL